MNHLDVSSWKVEVMPNRGHGRFRPIGLIRRVSPKSVSPEHALFTARKIVSFIQDGKTLSKKVMEDLD